MCKVYKIDFHSLNTVHYYTGQSDVADDVFRSKKTSLHKCGSVNNSIVKLFAERRLLSFVCCLSVCLSVSVCLLPKYFGE